MAPARTEPQVGEWTEHRGWIAIAAARCIHSRAIDNVQRTYTIEELKAIAEREGYSAISVHSSGRTVLMRFSIQLTLGQCQQATGHTLYIRTLPPIAAAGPVREVMELPHEEASPPLVGEREEVAPENEVAPRIDEWAPMPGGSWVRGAKRWRVARGTCGKDGTRRDDGTWELHAWLPISRGCRCNDTNWRITHTKFDPARSVPLWNDDGPFREGGKAGERAALIDWRSQQYPIWYRLHPHTQQHPTIEKGFVLIYPLFLRGRITREEFVADLQGINAVAVQPGVTLDAQPPDCAAVDGALAKLRQKYEAVGVTLKLLEIATPTECCDCLPAGFYPMPRKFWFLEVTLGDDDAPAAPTQANIAERDAAQPPAPTLTDEQPRTSINAPQGPLGLIFDPASTVVAKVREASPLYGRVEVGWTLVALDGEDVSHLDASRVTKLLKMRSHNPKGRRLEFKTPKKVNAEPPAPTPERTEEQKAALEAFADIDADGDGELTAEEIHRALSKNNAGVTLARVHEIMAKADKDKNGTISREEYLDAVATMGAGWLVTWLRKIGQTLIATWTPKQEQPVEEGAPEDEAVDEVAIDVAGEAASPREAGEVAPEGEASAAEERAIEVPPERPPPLSPFSALRAERERELASLEPEFEPES